MYTSDHIEFHGQLVSDVVFAILIMFNKLYSIRSRMTFSSCDKSLCCQYRHVVRV